MENEDFLNAKQVHVGEFNGSLALYNESGFMVWRLEENDNPEMVARDLGWRLVQAAC